MITRKRSCVVAAVAALLLLVTQPLLAQRVAARVKPELERAWAFGRARQYDQQLEVYDKLVAAPELSASIPFRPFGLVTLI
ncbi:MAG: hypothetical protein AMS16_03260 [Planctomycetes bacterium DG_58]|nr:MAG: hypothetical protein AMS16_03260 [Planctomycetes bacterium DG_58]